MALNLFLTAFLALSSLLGAGLQNDDGAAIFRIGEDIVVRQEERVPGDVVALGGHIVVDGEVLGTAVAIGGNTTVSGRVTEDAVAIGGNLHLLSTAFVGNDAVSVGGRVLREQGASVEGRVVEGSWRGVRGFPFVFGTRGLLQGEPQDVALWLLLSTLRAFAGTVFLVVVGVVAVAAFPRPTSRLAETLLVKPALTLAIGFLTAFLLPFFLVAGTVALAITIIGALVIPLFYLGVFVLGLFGLAGLGYAIGEQLLISLNLRDPSRLLAAVVGMVLLSVVTVVPLAFLAVLGLPLTYLAISVGLAMVVLSRFGTLSPASPAPPATTD